MTLANKQTVLLFWQNSLYRGDSSVSRETPGASGEANPRYPGHHATQANSARLQVGAQ